MDNTRIIRDIYMRLGNADLNAILERLDLDVDWQFVGPPQIPLAGRYRGRAQVEEYLRRLEEEVEILEFSADEFITQGDTVVALGHEHLRARRTGLECQTPWCHLFRIRDGRVIEVREFYDTAALAEAFRGASVPTYAGQGI